MALMTILVILISLSGRAAAETCGTSGRSCSDRATCNQTTSTCHCNHPYTWGNGFFQCYKPDQIAAEAKNDVHITTFNNETAEFPFPCRYLFTDVKQMIRRDSKGENTGMCQFNIYAFNKRFRGKIVTYGYDVTIYSGRHFNSVITGKSIRVFGTAANMVKNITIMAADMEFGSGKEKYRDWSDSDQIDGSSIKFEDDRVKLEYTEDDYKSVFKVEACGGLEITFIPYDTELRRSQKHIPGLSVSFKERDNNVAFQSGSKVIALGTNQYLNDILYDRLNAGQSLTRRGMLNSEETQNQPDPDEWMVSSCEDAFWYMGWCDRTARTNTAFTDCYWMLEEPRFIRCLSDHGYHHIDFFQTCLDNHCYDHHEINTGCQGLMETVEEKCNLTDISKVNEFINGDLCRFIG